MTTRVIPGPRYASAPQLGGIAARYGASSGSTGRVVVRPGPSATRAAQTGGIASRYSRLGIGTSTSRPAALGGGTAPRAPRVTRRSFINARTSAAAAVSLREELQRQSDKKRNFFQRVVGNAANDTLAIATGLPSTVALGAKNVAAANAAPIYAAAVAARRVGVRIPGTSWSGGVVRGAVRSDVQAGKATVADYRYRYGGLVTAAKSPGFGLLPSDSPQSKRAIRRTVYRSAIQHPVLTALDIAGLYSGAGAGIRAGAEVGARLTGSARLAAIGERSILPEGKVAMEGGRVSTGARYRAPKVREAPMGPNTAESAVGRVETARRPYSANPITRGIHKHVIEPAAQRVSRYLEAKGNAGVKVAKPFSSASRFYRAAARQARDLRYTHDLARARRLGELTRDLVRATREVEGMYGKDVGRAAIYMHTRDLLDVPGETAAEARDAFAAHQQAGSERAVAEWHAKNKNAMRQIEGARGVPEEALNLATAPEPLQRAVAAAKEVSRLSTEMRVEAQTITPETAAAMGSRAAEQVHGGSRYDAQYVRLTPRVTTARQQYAAAVAARDAVPTVTEGAVIQRAYSAGRTMGRGERNLQIAVPMRGTRRYPVIEGTPEAAVENGARSVSLQRGPGVSPPQAAAYGQQLRGTGRLYATRSGRARYVQLQRGVRDARTELRAAEREARGGWTPSSRSDVGRNGVYWPEREVDRRAGVQRGRPHGAFGRLTQDAEHENHGVLFGMGNVSHDPRVLTEALDRALVDQMHPGFVKQFTDAFAFKDPTTRQVAQGDRALTAMAADPDHVVLMLRSKVEDAMRLGHDAPVGEMPESPLANAQEFSLAQANELPKAMRDDVIALPKAAVKAVREGWSQSHPPLMKWYDTPLQLWRRGILAFAPRWYLNNLFGNTFQYGMLTGGDIKAVFQARNPIFNRAVPDQIAGSTLVNDVRRMDPSMDVSAARRVYEHASNVGMDFNQKLESILRRAAYISKSKRLLRAEGVKIGRLTDEQLAKAIETMPPELVNQAVNETQLFMGDYVRMSAPEREILKRIFPFYSWMRVIGKFMMVVPFRHPKRAALVATLNRAAQAEENPNDPILQLYDRGRINLPGGFVVRTTGANPLATHAELVNSISTGNPTSVATGLASDVSPIFSPAIQKLTGRNTFGRAFSAPPGWNGTQASYGQDPSTVSPGSGLFEESRSSPSIFEMATQSVPIVPTLLRAVLAGDRTPYDTTSTIDLLRNRTGLGGRPDWQLYRPQAGERSSSSPMAQVPGLGAVPLAPFLSLLGANLRRRNPQAEVNAYFRDQAYQRKSAAYTARQIAKAKARAR